MFNPQTGPLAASSPRLLEDDRLDPAAGQPGSTQLRPWAPLLRLRPVKVETLISQLNNYERTIAGLRLIERHFPAALAGYDDLGQTGWWEIVAHLNNLVEESGWWEADWSALNEAWAWWMEDPGENGERLARYLTYIPARHYGLDPETILTFPPLELLHVLLDGTAGVASTDLLIAIELYDGIDQWSETDREAAWALLETIEADPGLYAEPVRWLPELARWACRRTGNHLLDRTFDPDGDGPRLRWAVEAEVEQTRSAWRRARPLIAQFKRLMEWYEADTSRLTFLANFLMEGINHEQLDW